MTSFKKTYPPIFLIGFMGAGKTSLGKIISKKFGLSHLDLDKQIENDLKKPILQIFQEDGEEAFRVAEKNILLKSANPNTVVSVGGGCPTYSDNMNFMLNSGMVIHLQLSFEMAYHRLIHAKEIRPIMQNHSKQELEEIYHQRQKTYHLAPIQINLPLDKSEILDLIEGYLSGSTLKLD